MTRRLAVLWAAGLMLGASLVRAEEPKEPKEPFTSETGRFSARFPAKPTEQKRTANTPAGLITAYLYVAPTPDMLFLVGYVDYPEATVKELGAEAILAEDRDTFVKTTQGKLTSDRKITLDGNPGREFKVEAGDKTQFLIREYLVQNRVYQVLSRAADLSRPEIKKFQDSFKVLK